MKEKIDFSVRSAIKTSRNIKEESRDNNTIVRGKRGKNIEKVQANVSKELIDVLSENQDWIDEQKHKIRGILTGIDENEVFQAFKDGLMIFFKQQYRLLTQDQKTSSRHSKAIPNVLEDQEYIREQIIAYTFDFIQLLKASIKEGMTPTQALEIASLSYHHNPDVLRELTKKYPEVNEIVINQAIIRYPSNPEKFINYYINKVVELSFKYPDVDQWAINLVALHHTSNPEKTIDRFLKLVPELKSKYPDVRITVIKQASLQPNPDSFIEDFKNDKTTDLKDIGGKN